VSEALSSSSIVRASSSAVPRSPFRRLDRPECDLARPIGHRLERHNRAPRSRSRTQSIDSGTAELSSKQSHRLVSARSRSVTPDPTGRNRYHDARHPRFSIGCLGQQADQITRTGTFASKSVFCDLERGKRRQNAPISSMEAQAAAAQSRYEGEADGAHQQASPVSAAEASGPPAGFSLAPDRFTGPSGPARGPPRCLDRIGCGGAENVGQGTRSSSGLRRPRRRRLAVDEHDCRKVEPGRKPSRIALIHPLEAHPSLRPCPNSIPLEPVSFKMARGDDTGCRQRAEGEGRARDGVVDHGVCRSHPGSVGLLGLSFRHASHGGPALVEGRRLAIRP